MWSGGCGGGFLTGNQKVSLVLKVYAMVFAESLMLKPIADFFLEHEEAYELFQSLLIEFPLFSNRQIA